MKLGAIDFLAKPMTPEALRQVVAEVLARHAEVDPSRAGPHRAAKPATMLSMRQAGTESSPVLPAEGLLKEAIKEHPDSAEPWYLLGVLHELQLQPGRDEAYEARSGRPGYEPAKLHLMKFNEQMIVRGGSVRLVPE